MGGINVKNTMIQWVLEKLAPHPCSGCGKSGVILCEDCKNDIAFESFDGCIRCGRAQSLGICKEHHSPLKRVYIVGSRQDTLKKLIDNLKFHNVKAAAQPLANLLATRLPVLPPNTVLVPIPTVSAHSRARGYDQVLLLTKHLAHTRNMTIAPLLRRVTNTTQHTQSRAIREQQASFAYEYNSAIKVVPGTTYLLIDDVVTTGSTLNAAAEVISQQGGVVWAAGLAYQPAH